MRICAPKQSIAGHYFVLPRVLEDEIAHYAQRTSTLCCHLYWDDPDIVTVAFWEPEDALQFEHRYRRSILRTYAVGMRSLRAAGGKEG